MRAVCYGKPTLPRIAIAIVLCLMSVGVCLARGEARPTPTTGSDGAAGSVTNARIRSRMDNFAPWLGLGCKPSADKGVLVSSIAPDSPALAAGLKQGDIIVSLGGSPVASVEAFQAMVAKLGIGVSVPISVLRDGQAQELSIRPVGRAKTSASSAEITDKPAPRKGPMDINVLKYALIDQKTRTVTFIGKYDPAYNTGPIPYADLLLDAVANPYPSFSLDPDSKQKTQIAEVDKRMAADTSRMMRDPAYCNEWAQRLLPTLLDTSTADGKRFMQNCGEGAGITGDEMKRLFDAANGKAEMSASEMFTILGKMMRSMGSPRAGAALESMASGGAPSDLLRNMATAFGFTSQFQDLESKRNSGALSDSKFMDEAMILCVGELCRELEAPKNQLDSVISGIRSGSQNTQALTSLMGEAVSNFITNKAGAKMLNGLVVGPEGVARMYGFPVPQSNLVFKNVGENSLLGDVLFKADYRLKSIATFPDARGQVAEHLTHQEFDQREAAAKGYNLPAGAGAMLGHTLVPGEVTMRVSPGGDVVEFKDARVKIVSHVMDMMGTDNKGAEAFIRETMPKYAQYLTDHYDQYSKVYPEWHRLSEVAKVIALARWAKTNGYALSVANVSGAKAKHPATVNGFWSMVFQFSGDAGSLTLVAQGGASFDQNEGEDWLKPEPDTTVTSNVLNQLVASTVFAEQATGAAVSGDLEAARTLADKSALAMTGEIDLNMLPSLDGIPAPGEPAAYAAATAGVINEASACMNKIDQAQKDLARAQQLAATSPDEAAKLTAQATQTQDQAQARLKELLSDVSSYKTDPTKAGGVAVALQGSAGVVTPPSTTTSSSGSGTSTGTGASPATTAQGGATTAMTAEEWEAQRQKMVAELEKVNKQIASTQEVLRKLNSSIQSDRKLFDEWEKTADAGFDRCVKTAGDVAIDWGAGPIADRYDEIYPLAKKLPGNPEDVIEKYRLLASLSKRLKEAKTTSDYADLAAREAKTEAEIWESLRDGIGQVSGILGLDKTLPGAAWKYGSLAVDMAYNLTELRQAWKNVTQLEGNNERYAEAVKKLTERMEALVKRQQELRRKIEAGEQIDFAS